MDYKLLTDIVLVNLLMKGDEFAFQEIYLRYWKKLYRSVFRIVQVHEPSEELLQNIFVQLWEKRRETEIENLEKYLYVASKYSVFKYLRDQKVNDKYLKYAVKFPPPVSNSTETEVDVNDLSLALEEGISRLPPKTQLIFKLNKLENYSVKEISEKLNIPTRTIEHHLHHALKSLRVSLKDYIFLLVVIMVI